MDRRNEPDNLDILGTSLNAASKIQGALKTGKIVSSAAKGAAAGPYGMAAAILLSNKETALKIAIALGFLLTLPILFVMMLPSVIFNGFNGQSDALYNNAYIIANLSEAQVMVREVIESDYNAVMEKLNAEIAELPAGAKSEIIDSGNSVYFNTNLLISQYCAGKDNFKEINLSDLKNSLKKSNGQLYKYTKTTSVNENEETVYTYTVSYAGDDFFATNVFRLTEEQRILANSYAQNMMLFFYGTNYHGGGAGSADVTEDVLRHEPLLRKYAEIYGIPQYVEVLKALVMQESGGRHVDVMQSSECGYNTKYPRRPQGITDTEYSVDCGVHYFADALEAAGCTSPADINKLSLALQGYNYGISYIPWALRNYGGYSEANAAEFSNIMKAKTGWRRYGDIQYVQHVLQYYNPYGGTTADGFGSPFTGRNWREAVTSECGYRVDPLNGSKGAYHDGLDIAYPTGTPINSIGAGTVISVIHSNTGFGNHLIIDHGNGITSMYAHCSKLLVSKGQSITQGQEIALVGATGRVTGPHLHLTIKKDGNVQNPRDYIK